MPLLGAGPHRILIDGLRLPEIGYAHDALVDGDARCQSIAAAAVLAKTVPRPPHASAGPRYPGYGWDTNVGYGTRSTRTASGCRAPPATTG